MILVYDFCLFCRVRSSGTTTGIDPLDGDKPKPSNNIATTIVFIINGMITKIQDITPRLFLHNESSKNVITVDMINFINAVLYNPMEVSIITSIIENTK